MKKLVYLVTHGVTANVLLRGQLTYLRERNFDVTVIASPGSDLDAVAKREGVRTIGVPMSRSVRLHEGPRALIAITRALRSLRPDIVNASTAKAGLLGMLAASALRIPRRVYLIRGLRFEGYSGAKRRVLAEAERIASLCATDVVAVSKSVGNTLVREGLAPQRKLGVIPSNGIDPSRFRARAETRDEAARIRRALRIPADAFVAGFVGRLVADKGVDDMLDALERVPDAWFLVVGGNLAGDALPSTTTERLRAHPRVVLTGTVPEPAPYYAAMDALLFASYREGLPNVPLEAAASELAVVGYRVTGVVDAVEDGVTGTLVDKNDRAALGSALANYATNRTLRAAHGRSGRDRVLARFTQAATWAAWAELYESVHAR
ncbi:MAG TPA: glycosyltransferase family 4 protein [Polyangiaceae bacterium]